MTGRIAIIQDRMDSDKYKFIRELKKQVAENNTKAIKIQEKLNDPIIADVQQKPSTVVDFLRDIGWILEEIVLQSHRFTEYVDDLDLEIIEYEHIHNIHRDY